jgi:hypothetical protein
MPIPWYIAAIARPSTVVLSTVKEVVVLAAATARRNGYVLFVPFTT